ncbi:MoaD/ThiS family protein [Chloroflexota bacterium]
MEDDGLVSDLVNQVVAKHPALGQAILNPESQQILEPIAVFINNRQLRLPGERDTKLEDGDRVIFLMALSSG